MAGQPAMKGKHPIRTEALVATVTIDSAVNPAAPHLCECSTPALARLHSPWCGCLMAPRECNSGGRGLGG